MNFVQSMVVAQLVQFTILGLVSLLLAETLFRHRPRMQYALWSVVLLKCLVPPLVPSLIWPGSMSGPAAWSISENSARTRSQSDTSFVTMVKLDAVSSDAMLPQHAPATTGFWSSSFATFAVVFWLIGFLLILLLISMRVRRVRRQLGRRWMRNVIQLESAFSHVQERLRTQTHWAPKARLIVTRGRFGPAAMWPINPTIAIPGKLAEQLTSKQLQPVLAHEIMHVRRGDLWLGWLQTVVVCLFWFHPLVWLASRRLSIAIEHCCDEDTLRLLQCDPADYRHGLLATILWKNSVPALPVASAIRHAQLTRSRMEALMKIDLLHSAPRWRPRLLWLLISVLVLPGASVSVSAPPISLKEIAPAAPEDIQAGETTSDLGSEVNPGAEETGTLVRVYRVVDIVTNGKSVVAGKRYNEMPNIMNPLLQELMTEVAPESWEAEGGPGTMAPYPQNLSIVISATKLVHDKVVDFLEEKRAKMTRVNVIPAPMLPSSAITIPNSADKIELRLLVLRGTLSALEMASDAWRLSDDYSDSNPSSTERTILPLNSQNVHLRWAIVDPESIESFVKIEANYNRVWVCSRPTLVLSQLTKGIVEIVRTNETPVPTDDTDLISEKNWIGMKMDFTASESRSADGRPSTFIALNFSSQQKVSGEVESIAKPGGSVSGDSALALRAFAFKMDVPNGKTLLVLQSRGDDDVHANLIAIERHQ